ncbi:hypothetical protein OCAE111667_00610 [Occultella aeris]|uniref:Uncharacterized protein n=1 Tax=Occultella aeris TaxID=2761496 RepID=A0A7M4DSS1_9MICO|nr:hypothetical protein [Occultella aeris]VZO40515.1 hypothetical protein HALOF300_05222 [Occultella aeris]
MAREKEPYEVRQVNSDRLARKLQRQGWELMGQSGGALMSARTYTLRRPNPRSVRSAAPQTSLAKGADSGDQSERTSAAQSPGSPAPSLLAAATPHNGSQAPQNFSDGTQPPRATKPWYLKWWVLLIGALILIGLIGQALGPGDTDPTSPAVPAQPSPSPTPDDEETEPPSGVTSTAVTDAEVIDTFTTYLEGRANDGVVLAIAVESVTFEDGVVRVVFNPALAGLSTDAFLDLNPYDNLAEFPGTVIAFTDDEGRRLRTVVDGVATFLPDETDLGSLTTAEIFELGTGEVYTPGN